MRVTPEPQQKSSWRGLPLAWLTAAAALVAAGAVQAGEDGFDCVIEPQQMVKLSSSVTGVIASVEVDRGDYVNKGQVVARIEDSVEEANLNLVRAKAENDAEVKSKEAAAEFLQRKYDRLAQLQQRQVASAQDTEEAFANAKSAAENAREAAIEQHIAQLEMKQAEAVVERRRIRSPVDGVVAEISLHPGEFRNDQSPIMTLAQIDPLRVEVFVPTAYYGRIAVNSEAEVEPESPVGGTYRARVDVVDRVLDAASGTFGVRLILPNADHRLPGGLKCKIWFPSIARSTAAGE
jgi:RND family efflux transporter MFP subunit